jgi:xylan 1,4-beta-xylosidase
MGPWLANNIKQCRGLVNELAYWCVSDVFEEQGVIKTPFYGGFGLIAEGGIPKASFNAFKLLHKLGDQEYALDASNAIVTKRADGTVVIAAWQYVPPEIADLQRTENFKFTNIGDKQHAKIWKVDPQRGSALLAWQTMGKPAYPSKEQWRQLKAASELGQPALVPMTGENKNELALTLDRDQLVLIEICK